MPWEAPGQRLLQKLLSLLIFQVFQQVFLLSLGRALGETMAVTILIGNSPELPHNIFSPSHTMASVIANEFSEAGGIYGTTLIEVGLLLFVVTTIINFIGRIIIKRVSY